MELVTSFARMNNFAKKKLLRMVLFRVYVVAGQKIRNLQLRAIDEPIQRQIDTNICAQTHSRRLFSERLLLKRRLENLEIPPT
jgi:hypothetical protein